MLCCICLLLISDMFSCLSFITPLPHFQSPSLPHPRVYSPSHTLLPLPHSHRLARAVHKPSTSVVPKGGLSGRKGIKEGIKDTSIPVPTPNTDTHTDSHSPHTPHTVFEEIEQCLPQGDESWVAADTGLVLELNTQDLKALDKIQKECYHNQLRYQQSLQLNAVEEGIRRILRVWTPESGLIGQKGKTGNVKLETDEILNFQNKKNLMLGSGDDHTDDRTLSMILKEPSPMLSMLMEECSARNRKNVLRQSAEFSPTEEVKVVTPKKEKEGRFPERDVLSYSEYVTSVLPIIIESFRKIEEIDVSEKGKDEKIDKSEKNEIKGSEKKQKDLSSRNVTGTGKESEREKEKAEKMASEKILDNIENNNKIIVKNGIPDYGIFDILVEIEDEIVDVFKQLMALLPPPKVENDVVYPLCVFLYCFFT